MIGVLLLAYIDVDHCSYAMTTSFLVFIQSL